MIFAKRVATAVLGLPFVLFAVYTGGLLLVAACAFLALAGLREFYRAFSKTDRAIHALGYIATVGYFAAIYIFGAGDWVAVALAAFIVAVQACLVVFFGKLPISECVTTVYGFLYVPFLLSFVVLVRANELGPYLVWLIFIACFGCDTFAYLVGSLFGRRKLTNSPSPSKSVEGLIGGVVGATLLGLLYGYFVARPAESPEFVLIIFAAISFVGAIFSILGDLAASAVKRHCEIKDFGNIFPGHGGFMDRLDSVLTVAPVVYLAVTLWPSP